MTISLGRTLPYDSSSLPGAQWDRADPRTYATCFAPAWPCSRWGLPGRSVTTYAGGLLHHLFTLTSCEAVCFLWPFSGKLPRPGRYPASCSKECGLSSARTTPCRDHLINLTDIIIIDFSILWGKTFQVVNPGTVAPKRWDGLRAAELSSSQIGKSELT